MLGLFLSFTKDQGEIREFSQLDQNLVVSETAQVHFLKNFLYLN